MKKETLNNIHLYSLFLYAVINPLVAQGGNYFLPGGIGGLSLMQLYQGVFFLYVLYKIPFVMKYPNIYSRRILRLLMLFVFGFTIISFRVCVFGEVVSDFVMYENLFYFKLIFALTLWYYASLVVRNGRQAEVLLKCIVAGSVLTCICIFYFYFTGEGIVQGYASAGVKASFGAEGVSGKATVSYLITSIFISLYLSGKGKFKSGLFMALIIVAGTYLTYGRAGQVAFCFGLMWLLIWNLFISEKRKNHSIIVKFVALLFVAGFLYFITYGYEQLVLRWTHDFDQGEIGSGRGTFYAAAFNWFTEDSSLSEMFLGMGFGNIPPLMFYACGIYLHTHSDLFDMLVTGGIAGVFMYIMLLGTVLNTLKRIPVSSIAFGVGLSIIISFGVMTLITGVFSATHGMFCFGVSILCIEQMTVDTYYN